MSNSLQPTGVAEFFSKILKGVSPQLRKRLICVLLGLIGVAALETTSVVVIAAFISAIASPDTTVESTYFSWLVDTPVGHLATNPDTVVPFLGACVLASIIIKNVLHIVVAYYQARYVTKLEAIYGERMLSGFLFMPYEWHLKQNSADLVCVLDWRVFFGRNFIAPCLQLISDIVIVASMLGVLLFVQPAISLSVLLIAGSIAFIIYKITRIRLDSVASVCLEFRRSMSRQTTKSIHGIKDVLIKGVQNLFVDGFSDLAHPITKHNGEQQIYTKLPMLILEMVGFILLVGTVCFLLIIADEDPVVTTGTITLLGLTAWRVLPAVGRILGALSQIRGALPYLRMNFEYLDEQERVLGSLTKLRETEATPPRFDKRIDFNEVSFKYSEADRESLKNVSFSINKGETIGIVGSSGAGKSTLVDILTGLLKPSSGEIRVDGAPFRHSPGQGWGDTLGYVPQSTYICDGTLLENIAFGIPVNCIDRDRVQLCCDLAAIDFLSQLSDGLDTQIGERGIKLSGGQRQRVAIARALYSDPELIIFDEATSALDGANEKAIQDTIYSLKGKRTLLIVAHRLSTVRDCDFLVWLEDGRIRKIGAPDDIISEIG